MEATPTGSEVEAMSKPFQGVVNIDVRDSVPDWSPYMQPVAPEGAPNVLYIVLDDTGFSAMEPWGGLIETPNINRLAANGRVGLLEADLERRAWIAAFGGRATGPPRPCLPHGSIARSAPCGAAAPLPLRGL
jgi:hypothetical protein